MPDTIEQAIQRAREQAQPAMSANFVHPDWVMSAGEFRDFWRGARMAAVGTAGSQGNPHSAPLEVTRDGDVFIVPTYANAVRLTDLRVNQRVVTTTWDDPWHCAIVYGVASFPEQREGMVQVVVQPSRIYAIRAPSGHPASRHA